MNSGSGRSAGAMSAKRTWLNRQPTTKMAIRINIKSHFPESDGIPFYLSGASSKARRLRRPANAHIDVFGIDVGGERLVVLILKKIFLILLFLFLMKTAVQGKKEGQPCF